MFHPLLPDLSSVSTEELHKKYADLQKRTNVAHRYGSTQAVQQLQMLINGYHEEIQRRNQKALEDMMAKGGKFKNIIDIQ